MAGNGPQSRVRIRRARPITLEARRLASGRFGGEPLVQEMSVRTVLGADRDLHQRAVTGKLRRTREGKIARSSRIISFDRTALMVRVVPMARCQPGALMSFSWSPGFTRFLNAASDTMLATVLPDPRRSANAAQ
jgi:hypothetical protein